MTYDTRLGISENKVAALAYAGMWLTGILLLLIERENKFVRFHAMQSLLTFLPLSLFVLVVAWVPYAGWIIADFVGFPAIFLALLFIVMAYKGMKFKIPFVGNYAYKLIYG